MARRCADTSTALRVSEQNTRQHCNLIRVHLRMAAKARAALSSRQRTPSDYGRHFRNTSSSPKKWQKCSWRGMVPLRPVADQQTEGTDLAYFQSCEPEVCSIAENSNLKKCFFTALRSEGGIGINKQNRKHTRTRKSPFQSSVLFPICIVNRAFLWYHCHAL